MKKLFRLLLLAMPLLAVGCYAEGPEEPEVGEIVLDNIEIVLPASSVDAHYIRVRSTYAWSAQSSVEWLSFKENRGDAGISYLCMSVSENTEPTERQGVICFTTDDYNLSAELLVTQEAGSPKQLILVADKTTIYDNGEDCATFSLYYDGITLKDGYELYVGETPLAGNTFSSKEMGTFVAWAAYGTVISNDVLINVIATPPAAPAVPEDKNPTKTNFSRRVLFTQFTGTGCGYCPNMMNALHQFVSVSSLNESVVIAAAHMYNENDPAYLVNAKTLDNSVGVSSFPSLVADLNKSAKADPNYASLVSLMNSSFSRVSVKGGIAVNSKYDAERGYITINALVKAKETAEFRIGAWVLEDNIKATQSNYGFTPLSGVDFNNHNNCIRIADSKYANTDFTGYSLGTIEAGKTASREFSFKLADNGEGGATYWNHDNLRVIVFISTKEGSNWYVNNVVKCPKHGSVDFEYED